MMFAVAGMMLFPAANDLLTMFVALEVLSLPLYLLCGLARRRRLLSQEAAMKYFLLGAFSSAFFIYGVALRLRLRRDDGVRRDQRGGPRRPRQPVAAADRHRHGRPSACSSRSAPRRSTPGPPTSTRAPRPPVTAFMAACTKIAAFGAILRLFYVAFGSERWTWQPMLWVVAILTMVVGAVLAVVADRHEADARLLLDRPHRLPAHRRPRRAAGLRALRRPGHLDAGGAVLPDDLRLRDDRRLRRRHRWSATPAARRRTSPAGPAWASRSPLVAGLFAFFLLSMAGIPLTAGFIGKWAVFAVALSAGAWPVVIVGDALQHRRGRSSTSG